MAPLKAAASHASVHGHDFGFGSYSVVIFAPNGGVVARHLIKCKGYGSKHVDAAYAAVKAYCAAYGVK